jgi:hypothetical protein
MFFSFLVESPAGVPLHYLQAFELRLIQAGSWGVISYDDEEEAGEVDRQVGDDAIFPLRPYEHGLCMKVCMSGC